jgi:hypothetical protein
LKRVARSSVLLSLLLMGGCRNLLNLEAYDFEGTGGGGAGGAGGSGAGNPCAAGLVPNACGEGQKCGLIAVAQGLEGGAACMNAGSQEAWSLCRDDTECSDTTFCEPAAGVCKPWCDESADTCPLGAACIQARNGDGTVLPGLSVCTAHCNPDAPDARCGPGVSCVMVPVSEGAEDGDCVATAGRGAGCPCNATTDCDPGLRCDLALGECRAWCKVGSTCPGGPACSTVIVEYEGEELGQCPPPAGMCIE